MFYYALLICFVILLVYALIRAPIFKLYCYLALGAVFILTAILKILSGMSFIVYAGGFLCGALLIYLFYRSWKRGSKVKGAEIVALVSLVFVAALIIFPITGYHHYLFEAYADAQAQYIEFLIYDAIAALSLIALGLVLYPVYYLVLRFGIRKWVRPDSPPLSTRLGERARQNKLYNKWLAVKNKEIKIIIALVIINIITYLVYAFYWPYY